MLTAFFDKVELYGLYYGSLPLTHYDHNNNANVYVDNHIINLADYMGTCNDINGNLHDPSNCQLTPTLDAMAGLDDYFSDHGYSAYTAHSSTSLNDLKSVIKEGNVVYLRMDTPHGRHACLGIGVAYVNGGDTQVIVKSGWEDHSGEYHISEDLFYSFIYMSK